MMPDFYWPFRNEDEQRLAVIFAGKLNRLEATRRRERARGRRKNCIAINVAEKQGPDLVHAILSTFDRHLTRLAREGGITPEFVWERITSFAPGREHVNSLLIIITFILNRMVDWDSCTRQVLKLNRPLLPPPAND
jgi:hypothetical protein